jgi:LDH2 family malate/lactate/ureidoglycolate dehydrogenase
MIDVLCGPLAGAAWSAHVSGARGPAEPAAIGHAFVCWRIDAFRDPDGYFSDLNEMVGELRAATASAGHESTGVLVPGDPELEAEARNRELGIPIKPAVLIELRRLAGDLGLALPLDEWVAGTKPG